MSGAVTGIVAPVFISRSRKPNESTMNLLEENGNDAERE